MADILALPNWPHTLGPDMVTQGSTARSHHGTAIETALRHLCGWGWLHGGATTGYGSNHFDVTLGNSEVLARIRLLPFARALEVGVLCDGVLSGTDLRLAYSVTVGGVSSQIRKDIAGAAHAYGDYSSDVKLIEWDTHIFDALGDGSNATDAAQEITISCDDPPSACASMYVFGYYIRQLFNFSLSQ